MSNRPTSPWVKDGWCERHWWSEKETGIPCPWCDIEIASRKMQDAYGQTVNNLRRKIEEQEKLIDELSKPRKVMDGE